MYQSKGSSADKLSSKGVRGHQCDLDVLCSQGTLGSYGLLAVFSPQLASLTVHLTTWAWERQSQAGISVQRGSWKRKSDELHPLRNTWGLKYFKFSWECPDFSPETTPSFLQKHPVHSPSSPFTAVHFLSEAKHLYLIWLTLLSNSLPIFEKLYHWPLSYLQVALHIPSWSFAKKQTRGKDSLLHIALQTEGSKHLSRQRGDMGGNNLPAWEDFVLVFNRYCQPAWTLTGVQQGYVLFPSMCTPARSEKYSLHS